MIAHRLETAITYSDRILVMDRGSVREFDHSFNLLMQNPEDMIRKQSAINSDRVAPM